MRVALLGRTQLLYESGLRLLEAGHQIAAVITAPSEPEYTRKEEDFQRLAQESGAGYLCQRSLDGPEAAELLKGVDVAVSVNWPTIITESHVALTRLGIINAHMGDLPRYRGNACPNWAILRGEEAVILSLHLMEGGRLDCGPILVQERLPLDENVYIADVYAWVEEVTPRAFVQALDLLAIDPEHRLKYADPGDPRGFRCYPRTPLDGFIDWSQSAVQIQRLVRAAGHPFQGAYTYLREGGAIKKLIIERAHVQAEHSGDVYVPGQVLSTSRKTGLALVGCGQGVLALERCRYQRDEESFAPGKRWRGVSVRLGLRAEDMAYQTLQGK